MRERMRAYIAYWITDEDLAAALDGIDEGELREMALAPPPIVALEYDDVVAETVVAIARESDETLDLVAGSSRVAVLPLEAQPPDGVTNLKFEIHALGEVFDRGTIRVRRIWA